MVMKSYGESWALGHDEKFQPQARAASSHPLTWGGTVSSTTKTKPKQGWDSREVTRQM